MVSPSVEEARKGVPPAAGDYPQGTPMPLVAIVGRPNVGKSTLFNRLLRERVAIVEDLPGTTRDRLYADTAWRGRAFTLVDTGGLDPWAGTDLARAIRYQVEEALAEADVILFLVDAKEGGTAIDLEIAQRLRQAQRPLLLVANKAESPRRQLEIVQFYELGLGEPHPISAYHGSGVDELLDALLRRLPAAAPPAPAPAGPKVALVGRPNVGKSSLLNALLGEKRAIVQETPGTTRDAIDTELRVGEDRYLLIDTAGIRRRGHIQPGVERFSVLRALRAIERSDVVLLLVDATEFLTAQDLHIAGLIKEAAKGMVLLINKWDLLEDTKALRSEYARLVRSRLRFMAYVPHRFISAKVGTGMSAILPLVCTIYQQRLKRIATGPLNRFLEGVLAAHPPGGPSKALKIHYLTQVQVNPPSFVFFVNDAASVHFSYQRYLENRLRQAFGFQGTPLRLEFRKHLGA